MATKMYNEPELPSGLLEQIRVSKILSLGFVFSLVWLGGIGSLISFILGLRSLFLIVRSHGALKGKFLAWWCIIVGGVGMVVLPAYIITSLVHFLD